MLKLAQTNQPTDRAKTICFNLWQNFIGTNVLTLTTAPPPPPRRPSIVRTNVLIKFHKDWIINVTSSVLTRF
ncbi:hypothetical protein DPMN_183765, partial [Dreissena polymorpha]